MTSDNDFKEYLFNRIERANYRGIHLSQHNRLPFTKVYNIINIIYQKVGLGYLKIPIGDYTLDKEHRRDLNILCKKLKKDGYLELSEIILELQRNNEKGTPNSLKKNIFPDLETMGLIKRFDAEGQEISHHKKGIYSIKLTRLAESLITENNVRKRYKIYVECVEQIVKPIIDDLFFLLYNTFEQITIYEYMYILSDYSLDTQSKIKLIKQYRKMRKTEQIKIKQEIKLKFDQMNAAAEDKSEKRDFVNWYNEELQIFNLLNQTVYFKTYGKAVLLLSISQDFIEQLNKRSQQEKEKCISWHNISETAGYELHHIYPLAYATSKKEMKIIDDYKNLICIKKEIHSKIDKFSNLHVILEYQNNKIYLTNISNKEDKIDITTSIIIKIENITKMIKYNTKLLLQS